VVAVGVAAACAAADAAAAVVVGDVECGGGVEARDRCADRERRDEDEEDDDVDDAGDAAAADERCLDEPGLLERAGLRDGVSGGREGWTGSGAVAAVAAATMPSRVPRRGGDLATRGGPAPMQVPGAPAPPPALPLLLRAPLRRRAASGSTTRLLPASTRGSSVTVCGGRRQGMSEVGILCDIFFNFFSPFAAV
jgi:hypothetical protein